MKVNNARLIAPVQFGNSQPTTHLSSGMYELFFDADQGILYVKSKDARAICRLILATNIASIEPIEVPACFKEKK